MSFHVNNGSVSTFIYAFHTKVTLFRIYFCKLVFYIDGTNRTDVLALATSLAAENYNVSSLI